MGELQEMQARKSGPGLCFYHGALIATVGFFSAIFGVRTTIGIIVGIIGILIIIAAWNLVTEAFKRSEGCRR